MSRGITDLDSYVARRIGARPALRDHCRMRRYAPCLRIGLPCLLFVLGFAGASARAQSEAASDTSPVAPADSASRLYRSAPFAAAARVSAALERGASDAHFPTPRNTGWMREPPEVRKKRRPFVLAGAVAGGVTSAVMLVRDSHNEPLGTAGAVLLMPILVPPFALAGGFAGYGVSLIFIPRAQ